MVKKRTVIIYPHIGEKSGSGHIKRLLPFFHDSRFNTYITHKNSDLINDVCTIYSIPHSQVLDLDNIDITADFILLDNRSTDIKLYEELKGIAPIIAIDEGGDARDLALYTIDTLPNLLKNDPNYFNTGLLDLNRSKRYGVKKQPQKVLVSFGGQDPFGLTDKVVEKLSSFYDLTVVVGPLFKKREFTVKTLENIDDLKEIMSEYDLVITSFGLTAYESVAQGIPVALYNPTRYHQKLANNAGFYSLKTKMNIDYLSAIDRSGKIEIGYSERLVDKVYNLPVGRSVCPVCGENSHRVLARFEDKTYFKCHSCSITYMNVFTKEKVYNSNYFFSEYESQYGKTYLDDFSHIESMGLKRLQSIKPKIKAGSKVLDIGCAYGPFLSAVVKNNLKPYGIDISKDATEYVNKHLGLNAINSTFPYKTSEDFPKSFDVITMWYVIEHFKNLDEVLKEVNALLRSGGVFSFSTPNGRGISAFKSKRRFLQCSPDDHFTIFNPISAKKVLKDYGFKVYKVKITGHHPERFNRFSHIKYFKSLFMFISKLLKLGDTFEIYCVKEHSV